MMRFIASLLRPLHLTFGVVLAALLPCAGVAGIADLEGTLSYSIDGNRVTIEIGRIANNSSGTTTGTLFVTMRLTSGSDPYGSGYNVARHRITGSSNGSLGPGRQFSGIRWVLEYTAPPPGTYYVHFITSQHPSPDTALDVRSFTRTITVGGGGGIADIEGTLSYSIDGDQVTIEIGRIANNSSRTTTGTLFVTMRLTSGSDPYGTGYNVARHRITGSSNGSLGPGRQFSGIRWVLEYTAPPPGRYYVHFITSQHPSPDTALDVRTFTETITVGGGTGPPPGGGEPDDPLDDFSVSIPSSCPRSVRVCVRDHECEDGDQVRVTVNGSVVFSGEITNEWQCRDVPVREGVNSVEMLAINGTGFKGDCTHANVNTGEIRIEGGSGGQTQSWRHAGGAGSTADLHVTVGASGGSCPTQPGGGGSDPPPGDDHGNTHSSATSVALGATVAGRIEAADDLDYFRLDLRERAAIAVYTIGTLDTVGSLRDSTDREVAANDDHVDLNFRIEATLAAGIHYVRVESFGNGTGSYTLHVEGQSGSGPPNGGVPPGSEFTNSLGMEFALVPAGEFDMGSTTETRFFRNPPAERPVTQVRISRAFYLGKHEVTQGQWQAVMGTNPSEFANCGADCPVERVSWDDAQEFVRRLNGLEGGTRYRLPTEAEWEYAARAGTLEDRYSSDLDAIAWYWENSSGRPHPVGEKQANAFGLYDMLGNVQEWVQDWFGRYPGGVVSDPVGPNTGVYRVGRGCTWGDSADYCRVSDRLGVVPGFRGVDPILSGLGFRLARTAEAGGGSESTPPAADDHGNEASQATGIVIGQSLKGQIEVGSDADYFRLDLAQRTSIVVYTTGNSDTVGSLRDSTDSEVAANDDHWVQDLNFRIEATLGAGIHYVRVESFGNDTGSYILHVEGQPGSGSPDGGVPLGSELTNSVGMEFVLVPAGEFDMGSATGGEGYEQPVTRVRISRAFYMGKHEVTQGQWEAVMGSNPSSFSNCGADCPVETDSWADAQEFVRRLNEREGVALYRLPTEAEWEYAARAGTTVDRYSTDVDAIAWHSGNSGGAPHRVGGKEPNAFGLHDMLGNVWEWVQDWYGPYQGGSVTDPTGPSGGPHRLVRGGSWYHAASYCRAAYRGLTVPGARGGALGFRLVRTAP